MPDLVNHPPHYTLHPSGVECIAMVEWMPCNMANAWKYLHRQDLKGAAAVDTAKALWYVRRELARRGVLSRQGQLPAPYYPGHVRENLRRFLAHEGGTRRETFAELWVAFTCPGTSYHALKRAESLIATMLAEMESTK